MIGGSNLDVPGIAVIPQGSVVVIGNRCSVGWRRQRPSHLSWNCSFVKSSVENTWYPVHASSKKQNMVCLSSGESELMALQMLTWDDCAVHGQLSSSGICETKGVRAGALAHVDTKVHFMQAWAMEPGQCILKVHGDSQQVADCRHEDHERLEQLIAKLSDSNLSNIDEWVRKIAAHQITASDLNTFTNTFLIDMRMKFVMTTT